MDPQAFRVVQGGPRERQKLLEQPFDHTLLHRRRKSRLDRHGRRREASHTGHFGARRQVAGVRGPYREPRRRRAAHRLGAVDQRRADLRAPDYVLATSDVIEPLAGKIAEAVTRFFGSDPQHSDSFGRIINARHFDRLTALLPDPKSPATGRTVCGGNTRRDDLYIAPTVLLGVKPDAPVMQEEISARFCPFWKSPTRRPQWNSSTPGHARWRPTRSRAARGYGGCSSAKSVAERWDSTCRSAI